MENLKQALDVLFELQKYDSVIEKINDDIKNAPLLIKSKNADLDNKKQEAELKKKTFVEINSIRKEKESNLAAKEQAIDKRSVELNSVKSNDTYKAILLEIEKAKADKSCIEDEILDLLMKIDLETASLKKVEIDLKEFESKTKNEIDEIANSVVKLKDEIKTIESKRENLKSSIDAGLLSHYERVRQGNGGHGICLVEKDACSICGNVLRPQLINQLRKGVDLIFCDNCSRILLKKD
jgi:predicted  nucleic acid-binding Zn-ribbon protein